MAGVEEITITGTTGGHSSEILSPEAIAFVVQLDREFGARRVQLLDRRRRRRATRTSELDFLASTASVRADTSWSVAPPRPGPLDRRVEITGPEFLTLPAYLRHLSAGTPAAVALAA